MDAFGAISEDARGNRPRPFGGNAGAGVWLNGAGCALRRCLVENNAASGYGGGVYANGTAVIEACSISGNTSSYGGGVYSEKGSSVTVAQCSLWANTGSGADLYDWNANGVRYLNCVMAAERVGKGVMTGCIVSTDRRAEALSGKGVSLTSETALEGRDLTARCILHEYDHLDGHLYSEKVHHWLTEEEMEGLDGEDEDE